jgi:hypothetical protein
MKELFKNERHSLIDEAIEKSTDTWPEIKQMKASDSFSQLLLEVQTNEKGIERVLEVFQNSIQKDLGFIARAEKRLNKRRGRIEVKRCILADLKKEMAK